MASIRENILDDVQETLEAMSQGLGYNFDWNRFYREVRDSEPDQYPSGFLETSREEVTPIAYPLLERRLPVMVHAVHMAQGDLEDTPGAVASMMVEDVERAIMQDVTRGGNAVDSLVTFNERVQVVEPAVYVIVGFDVVYRTALADPASVVN